MTEKKTAPIVIDRRRFLQLSGAGLTFGVAPFLASCGGASAPEREKRAYYFNLGAGATASGATQFLLAAGDERVALQPATAANLKAVREDIPSLPDDALTHVAEVELTGTSPQVCFVQAVHGPGPTDWSMHTMFFHVPTVGVEGARTLKTNCKAEGDLLRQAFSACPEGVSKNQLRGLAASASFCVGPEYDDYKDYFDHAISLVCNHPEVGSFDPVALSYIQSEIVCTDQLVYDLAVSIFQQGAATTKPGGWATLEPFTDPNTGKLMLDANGKAVCTVKYSQETLQKMGLAIASVLRRIKDDTRLGANITGLSADEANEALRGKMWFVDDGTPTAAGGGLMPQFAATAVAEAVKQPFTKRDVSGMAGYDVENLTGTGRTLEFTVRNSYTRYLGMYARFLDGNNNPIALRNLPGGGSMFPWGGLNGDVDGFIGLIQQQLAVFGIPIKDNEQRMRITVPEAAAAVQLLAGGLGTGSKTHPKTIDPGAAMTAVLCLAIPGVFLVVGAATGYATFCAKLTKALDILLVAVEVFVKAMVDLGLYGVYHDSSHFTNLILPIAELLMKGVPALYALMSSSVAEGQATTAATSAIPFGIGLAIQAVMALGLAAQITRTSVNVANSPWTYVTEVALTHDVTVTIHHDPLHAAGFPSTAAFYELTAVCDGSSPRSSGRIAMQSTTRTAPLTYRFEGLPNGGKVTISVTFTTANGALVGAGSTGNVTNTAATQSITIKEKLVDITAGTRYQHKQKTQLNAAGQHVWAATSTAPAAPRLVCEQQAGNLCELVGITVSDPQAAIAYGWRGYDPALRTYTGVGPANLYQLAALSVTDKPEAGYGRFPYGTPTPARVVYDRASPSGGGYYLDTTRGSTIVRRVYSAGVDKPAIFHPPLEGLAVGRFNFDSDAFLIHPTGKLISFNSAASKMEVLVPAATPVGDASAPQAQAYAGPGRREGLMLGPVAATVMHDGSILVVEQESHRVQAFDTGANPARIFNGSTFFPLRSVLDGATYLDISAEATGLIYVLLRIDANSVYLLDIYDKTGKFISRTTDVRAGKMVVSLFRDVYTLNFENIRSGGQVEPSVSLWVPNA